VLRRFRTLKAGEAGLSVITFGELVYGAENSAQRAAALELLRSWRACFRLMGLRRRLRKLMERFGRKLERKGQMIGTTICGLRAHAKAAGLTLVTNNERRVQAGAGLKVENWAGLGKDEERFLTFISK